MILSSPNPDYEVPQIGVHRFYRHWWSKYGSRIALIDSKTRHTQTYDCFLHTVERLAGGLQEIGVSPQERVCFYASNSIESNMAYFALQFLNATLVACRPSLTKRELLYQAKDTNSTCVIVDEDTLEVALHVKKEFPQLQKVILVNVKQVPSQFESSDITTVKSILRKSTKGFSSPSDVNPKDDVIIVSYTSGSTGQPKGVMHTHYSLISQLLACRDTKLFQEGEVYLAWSPLSHISGTVITTLSLIMGCMGVVGNAAKDNQRVVELVEEFGINCVVALPVSLQAMVRAAEQRSGCCPTLYKVLVGGSVIAPSLARNAINLCALKTFRIVYGLSETIGILTVTPDKQCVVNSIGKPVSNTNMKVIDLKTGVALGPRQSGEICAKCPAIMKGYWNNPEATREVIDEEGWFHTGDQGYFDEEGNFYIEERLKQMIKCLDNQLSPAELEGLLLEHEAVDQVVVIGLPSKVYGEAPTAYVVLKKNFKPSEELSNEMKTLIADQCAKYKHLYGGVHFIASIPQTESGKYSRLELKKALIGQTKSKNY